MITSVNKARSQGLCYRKYRYSTIGQTNCVIINHTHTSHRHR